MKVALFPGSFDPVTIGHQLILERGLSLFDKVVIGVGENSMKKYFFDIDQRIEMLETCFGQYDNIEIARFDGLTAAFADSKGIRFLLRGLRNATDLEYEKPISLVNKRLNRDLETVFFISSRRKLLLLIFPCSRGHQIQREP